MDRLPPLRSYLALVSPDTDPCTQSRRQCALDRIGARGAATSELPLVFVLRTGMSAARNGVVSVVGAISV